MFTFKKLDLAYENAKKHEIKINYSTKIILMSDCHRGNSSWADDFAHNQNVYYFALNHYYNKGFTYIELGDGEELWENKKFEDIRAAHSHIYELMNKFYKLNRLHLIWGNHNRLFKNPKNVKNFLTSYYIDRKEAYIDLFPDINIHEALILKHFPTNKNIFLIHGHQGEILNDYLWRLGLFFTRYIWNPLQLIGIKASTSPALNNSARKKVELKLKSWAENHKGIIIAGHTHRAVFSKLKNFPYFNTGSCVHPRCITGIEIEKSCLTLVKWFMNTKKDGTLFIDKEILEGPCNISNY